MTIANSLIRGDSASGGVPDVICRGRPKRKWLTKVYSGLDGRALT